MDRAQGNVRVGCKGREFSFTEFQTFFFCVCVMDFQPSKQCEEIKGSCRVAQPGKASQIHRGSAKMDKVALPQSSAACGGKQRGYTARG